MEIEEVDKFILDKKSEINNIINDYDCFTRKLAEKAFEIEKDSVEKFGKKGVKVFKDVLANSDFNHKVVYVRNLKYIPEKVYPILARIYSKVSPGDFCEEKGYSKFSDIAQLKSPELIEQMLLKVVNNEVVTNKDIRKSIRVLRGKSSIPDVASRVSVVNVEEVVCPFLRDDGKHWLKVRVDWVNRKIDWLEFDEDDV